VAGKATVVRLYAVVDADNDLGEATTGNHAAPRQDFIRPSGKANHRPP